MYGISIDVNEKYEMMVIKEIFGEYVYKVVISLMKLMIGYLLGVVGVVEVIFFIKLIIDGVIFLIINYEILDLECDLDYVLN